MEFKATLDLKSKIITGFITVLFLVIPGFNVRLINLESADKTPAIIVLGTMLLLIFVYVICYLYRPLKYIIDKDIIIVKRPMKDFTLELKNIKDVFIPTRESMKWTIRAFGNGGLFGYIGKFRNGTYGNMTWYATKTNHYVMIVTQDNEKIVLTPDDIEMATEIKKRLV